MRERIRGVRFLRSVLVLMTLAFVCGYAETVTLRDGSKLNGTITKQSESTLEIRTPYGILTIDKSNIVSIDFGVGPSETGHQPTAREPEKSSTASYFEYTRGQTDGRLKGYNDGYAKGDAEQKSSRMTGAWGGFLVQVALAGVIVFLMASRQY
jgi:hypothetical protein